MKQTQLRTVLTTIFIAATLGTASVMSLAAPAEARVSVFLDIAPPPPPVEVVPAPRVGYVWAPGYYAWRGHRHIWIPGRYIRERRGYDWVADRWEMDRGRYHYMPGYWRRY